MRKQTNHCKTQQGPLQPNPMEIKTRAQTTQNNAFYNNASKNLNETGINQKTNQKLLANGRIHRTLAAKQTTTRLK